MARETTGLVFGSSLESIAPVRLLPANVSTVSGAHAGSHCTGSELPEVAILLRAEVLPRPSRHANRVRRGEHVIGRIRAPSAESRRCRTILADMLHQFESPVRIRGGTNESAENVRPPRRDSNPSPVRIRGQPDRVVPNHSELLKHDRVRKGDPAVEAI
jgi:hypothetical protein